MFGAFVWPHRSQLLLAGRKSYRHFHPGKSHTHTQSPPDRLTSLLFMLLDFIDTLVMRHAEHVLMDFHCFTPKDTVTD